MEHPAGMPREPLGFSVLKLPSRRSLSGRILCMGDNNGEFVPAQSRDQINLPHKLPKTATDLD